MKISIELTSEQVEWAKRHAQQCQFATPSAHHHGGCSTASAIVAALPQPTLREGAYRVMYPKDTREWRESAWPEYRTVEIMASWLYENVGESEWGFRRDHTYWCAGVGDVEEWDDFDNLVDALASIVVGLANG